jgi:hypothetical protein
LTPQFDDIPAKDLTLWHVSIPITDDDDDDELPILLNARPEKKKLKAISKLFKVFGARVPEETSVPEDTIHIIVQRPPQGTHAFIAFCDLLFASSTLAHALT